MIIYALDANTISYLLRDEGNVSTNFQKEIINADNTYVIPYIVAYEVKRWLYDKPLKQERLFSQKFISFFSAVEEDAVMGGDVWDMAAQIYINLKQAGQLIGDADILIAAYCIVDDYTLVTRNTRDFTRINGLKLVNWFD